jgi:hypothetical protein
MDDHIGIDPHKSSLTGGDGRQQGVDAAIRAGPA